MQDYIVTLHRGVYAIQWREDGRQKRRSLGTEDKLEAERRAAQFVAIDEQAAADRYTVRELWARYRKTMEGRPAYVTMGYEEKALLPFFGDMLPSTITKLVCEQYTAQRRQARSPDGSPKLNRDGTPRLIKDGTILTELTRLAGCMNYALGKKLIAEVPEIARPSVPPPRERHLTRDEFKRFLAAVTKPHLRLFCVLAVTTAGRQEALLGLTWDRVDFDRRRINLKDDEIGGKNRAIVPMNESLRTALLDAQAKAVRDGTGRHVIHWQGGRVASVKKGLFEAGKRSGVEGVTPHVFRHTSAVWMAESRIRMEEIAQYLGHADHKVTERHYARFSPEFLAGAATSLEL